MGWAKTAVLLLKHGADPDAANADGLAPLDVARAAKYTKVTPQLCTLTAPLPTPSFHSLRSASSRHLTSLLFCAPAAPWAPQTVKVFEEVAAEGIDAVLFKYRDEL